MEFPVLQEVRPRSVKYEIKEDTFLFSALAIDRAILVLPTPKREKYPVLYGKKISCKKLGKARKIIGNNFRESAKMGNFGGINFLESAFLSSSFVMSQIFLNHSMPLQGSESFCS